MYARLFAVAALLATTTGCLTFERTRFSFDFRAGTGEVRFIHILSDNEMAPGADWAELVNEYIHGTKLETEHPTWQIVSKRLEARDGALDGVIALSFRGLADVGIFQLDKKAPRLWCAASDQTIVSTDGQRTTPIDTCVVWDRKAMSGVVEVAGPAPSSGARSLLPEFQAWDGARVPAVDPMGDLGSAFASALQSALAGGPMVIGGLTEAQVMPVVEPARAALQACGAASVRFEVGSDGAAALSDPSEAAAACLAPILAGLRFPAAEMPTGVMVPLP